MNKNLKKISKLCVVAASATMPFIVRAQNDVNKGMGFLSSIFGSSGGLTKARTASELIMYILQMLLVFSGIIAVVFIIIGGYFYITSAGNEEQAEKGQKTLTNAIIGVVVVIMSYVLVNVITNLVSGSGGGGYG